MTAIAVPEIKRNVRKELRELKNKRKPFIWSTLVSLVVPVVLELNNFSMKPEVKHTISAIAVGLAILSFLKMRSYGPRIDELKTKIESRRNELRYKPRSSDVH